MSATDDRMMTVFRLDNTVFRYGRDHALGPVSLAIGAGERLALIGPSGCGKTTLLKMLLGLLEPDAGAVSFRGAPVTRANRRRIRRSLGYVTQHGGLFPHMTAARNVTLMARELGSDPDWVRARLAALAELVQLEAAQLDRYPAELSGGQRQRVSLMRALMLEPEVLLFDEPLSALDPMIRFDLQRDLKAIFAEIGATVIMVTHDLAEARYLAGRIVLLRDGCVEQDGGFDDLVTAPASDFVGAFVRAQRGLSLAETPA